MGTQLHQVSLATSIIAALNSRDLADDSRVSFGPSQNIFTPDNYGCKPLWDAYWSVPHNNLLHTIFISTQTGELFDLEALSALCQETGRYTFFFTSWPLNMLVAFHSVWSCISNQCPFPCSVLAALRAPPMLP